MRSSEVVEEIMSTYVEFACASKRREFHHKELDDEFKKAWRSNGPRWRTIQDEFQTVTDAEVLSLDALQLEKMILIIEAEIDWKHPNKHGGANDLHKLRVFFEKRQNELVDFRRRSPMRDAVLALKKKTRASFPNKSLI